VFHFYKQRTRDHTAVPENEAADVATKDIYRQAEPFIVTRRPDSYSGKTLRVRELSLQVWRASHSSIRAASGPVTRHLFVTTVPSCL
jgi:hypothetical protein